MVVEGGGGERRKEAVRPVEMRVLPREVLELAVDEAAAVVVMVVEATKDRKHGSEEWKPKGNWIASEDCRV